MDSSLAGRLGEKAVIATLGLVGIFIGWNLVPDRRPAGLAAPVIICPCESRCPKSAPKPFRVACPRCSQPIIVTPPSTGEVGDAINESNKPAQE